MRRLQAGPKGIVLWMSARAHLASVASTSARCASPDAYPETTQAMEPVLETAAIAAAVRLVEKDKLLVSRFAD